MTAPQDPLDVLIVDDDSSARQPLRAWLERQGCRVREASGVAQARDLLVAEHMDLVLVDLELPDGTGLDLLAELRDVADTDTVVVSGTATIDAAIEALRLGARDFLPKPVELPRLQAIVQAMARTVGLRREVRRLRGELKRLGRFGEMIGVSPAMQSVYESLERVSPTDETVLIMGPTGTGKELTAATVHRLSRRADKAFVAMNCGAVSPTLIESELFGHERGSFTGADKLRKGVFEQADGGTLFLDEITEMPPEMQVKLLRVLETLRLTRVGGTTEIAVDVRIIAATNRDPHEAVKSGALRQDLLYRLFVFPVKLPALRERGADVSLLAESFLQQMAADGAPPRAFSTAALARLSAHTWPGNVRELRNVVKRAAIMAREPLIDVADLPLDGPQVVPMPAAEFTSGPRGTGQGGTGQGGTGPGGAGPGGEAPTLRPGMSVAEAERQLIELTLAHAAGDKRRAADMLGISLKTLYTRLKVYEAARSGVAVEAREV
jgi:DNA-binding NtrC family response regulator